MPVEALAVNPADTILRSILPLPPDSVRPYFEVCAVECWRRVSAGQLAEWSGIPLRRLKRQLAPTGLTPAGIAAWNLALHAAWQLDVAQLPARSVASSMSLVRLSALRTVLGARLVRFTSSGIEPGAFALALRRYTSVVRSAFEG